MRAIRAIAFVSNATDGLFSLRGDRTRRDHREQRSGQLILRAARPSVRPSLICSNAAVALGRSVTRSMMRGHRRHAIRSLQTLLASQSMSPTRASSRHLPIILDSKRSKLSVRSSSEFSRRQYKVKIFATLVTGTNEGWTWSWLPPQRPSFYQRDSLNEQQGEFPIDFRWMDGWMDVGQSVGGRGEERRGEG